MALYVQAFGYLEDISQSPLSRDYMTLYLGHNHKAVPSTQPAQCTRIVVGLHTYTDYRSLLRRKDVTNVQLTHEVMDWLCAERDFTSLANMTVGELLQDVPMVTGRVKEACFCSHFSL